MNDSGNVYHLADQALDLAQEAMKTGDYGSAMVALLSNICVTLAHINAKLDQPKVVTNLDTGTNPVL